jgi:uncharacterized caspase-like protein
MSRAEHLWRGLLLLCLFLVAPPGYAERRVALLIGNAGYTAQADKLKNPHNDAHDMAVKLQSLGFKREDIIYRLDLKVDQIDATLEEFRKKIGEDTVALFYYSGHGLQVNGRNYLPAVDARIDNEFSDRKSVV